ncbi:DUF692 family multinuclear iron-containing protein [Hyalangium rubrum]|uniref:DUF692 family protein n=1 Tax=Hyalangium rubrum TaxID=3103134 RepID=A0ABU5HBV1_9BACT|nr:DUF692 family multinuclear iron-containing protein [Hyalangium sp. s54d21]MDY7230574.1 DUF692 family protein [Hyalangium sp. s54d21]
MPPRVGLNLVTDDAFREAARPLFAEGLVTALEWDIDFEWGFAARELPDWAGRMLDLYGEQEALYGHGVWLSVLTAAWQPRQEAWLEHLARECHRRPYRHISEHFGFTAAGPFTRSAMLPLPYCGAAVDIGRDRLERLRAATGGPVGLEVLANTLSPADAADQGAFLDAVLEPGDGFLVLDVHNVWTQALNTGLPPEVLLESYPLERVRELHVSGGSWGRALRAGDFRPVRLDSHDGPLLPPVLALLRRALSLCSRCEVVIVERRGETFESEETRAEWQAHYRAVVELVTEASAAPVNPVRGVIAAPPPALLDMHELAQYQRELITALVEESDDRAILSRLRQGIAGTRLAPYLETFDRRMLELLAVLASQWAAFDPAQDTEYSRVSRPGRSRVLSGT